MARCWWVDGPLLIGRWLVASSMPIGGRTHPCSEDSPACRLRAAGAAIRWGCGPADPLRVAGCAALARDASSHARRCAEPEGRLPGRKARDEAHVRAKRRRRMRDVGAERRGVRTKLGCISARGSMLLASECCVAWLRDTCVAGVSSGGSLRTPRVSVVCMSCEW